MKKGNPISPSNQFQWLKLVSHGIQLYFLLQCALPPPHALPDLNEKDSTSTLHSKPQTSTNHTLKDDFVDDRIFQFGMLPITLLIVFGFFALNLIPFHQFKKWTITYPYLFWLPKLLWGQLTSPLYRPWNGFELISLMVCVGGSVFRQWAMSTLAEFFTYTVRILDNHELITTGPYQWLIHPSYTGIFLSMSAFNYSHGLRNWRWWVGHSIPIVLLYLRIQNEEKVLANHFQGQWDQYVQARWRVLPGIY